jgi:hypothetical protein
MKQILRRSQLSQSILRVSLALVISSIVMAVGMLAGTSIVGKQDRSAMRLAGIVSDTTCGSTHGTKTQGDAECTRLCVSLGAEYALAVGEKIYVLRGHQADLNTFAGDMVIIRGKIVSHNTVAVESVVPYIVWARSFTN